MRSAMTNNRSQISDLTFEIYNLFILGVLTSSLRSYPRSAHPSTFRQAQGPEALEGRAQDDPEALEGSESQIINFKCQI